MKLRALTIQIRTPRYSLFKGRLTPSNGALPLRTTSDSGAFSSTEVVTERWLVVGEITFKTMATVLQNALE
jgi:hypothetical protein